MSPKKPKGDRAPKRGLEEHPPNSRRSKRRAKERGSEAASATSAATLSAEELFKLKHADEFDDARSEIQDPHVEIKEEPTGDGNVASHAAERLTSVAVPTVAVTQQARSPSVSSPARNFVGVQSSQAIDRENVLDTLLSQEFNTEMTRHAVQQILHDARESVGSGNELGVAYVEARIDRLQQKGITSSRLDEVVQLFQSGFRDLLDQLSSRIQSIGGVSTPRTTILASAARRSVDRDKSPRVYSQSSAKRTERGTRTTKFAQKTAANNPHSQLAAFEASHIQSDSSESSSNDDDGGGTYGSRRKSKKYDSRYLANDDDYRDDIEGDRSEFAKKERSMLISRSLDSFPRIH
jgi:hypothetical protein